MLGSLLAVHRCPAAVTWDVLAEIIHTVPPSLTLTCTDPEVYDFCESIRSDVTYIDTHVFGSVGGGTILVLTDEEADLIQFYVRARADGLVVVTEDPRGLADEHGIPAVTRTKVYVPVTTVLGPGYVMRYGYADMFDALEVVDGCIRVPPHYDLLLKAVKGAMSEASTIKELAHMTGQCEILVRMALLEEWYRGNRDVVRFPDWVPPGTVPVYRDNPERVYEAGSNRELVEAFFRNRVALLLKPWGDSKWPFSGLRIYLPF